MNARRPNGRPSVAKTLRATPLFSAFPDADLEAVTHFCHHRALAPEKIPFREGEACSAVYCLISGLVKLYVSGPDHHEKVVEFVDPGRTFAEAAMFSGQGYPVTAMALDDSQVIAIDAFSLMRYLRQHADLAWQMLAVMSRRLHYLVNQLRSVSLHNSEQRLAAYLLENYDPEERDRPVARIPARRSELALMLGLTTETLCRAVAKFRRQGSIRTLDHDIVVQNPEALRELVNRPRR
jgi:CRP-like cAMP-binding protein